MRLIAETSATPEDLNAMSQGRNDAKRSLAMTVRVTKQGTVLREPLSLAAHASLRLRVFALRAYTLVPAQCEWGRPVPQRPQEDGVPVQDAASDEFSLPPEAKRDIFLASRLEPHFGQEVPCQ
jgi:hypothetical protein